MSNTNEIDSSSGEDDEFLQSFLQIFVSAKQNNSELADDEIICKLNSLMKIPLRIELLQKYNNKTECLQSLKLLANLLKIDHLNPVFPKALEIMCKFSK
jgi:hypothetical protein